jgi:hypothetical protein
VNKKIKHYNIKAVAGGKFESSLGNSSLEAQLTSSKE